MACIVLLDGIGAPSSDAYAPLNACHASPGGLRRLRIAPMRLAGPDFCSISCTSVLRVHIVTS